MKKYWQTLLTVGSIATLSASSAFGQTGYFGYNGGACAPNCELPPVCEPVAPACEPVCAPVCDGPPAACEPTCALPPAPCEPSCGPSFGCAPYCGPGYGYCGFGGCAPCYDLAALVGGALDVATAPFPWAAAMLTEGIYPDCGCAPRPPKTNCDPCDICGNFVGGCGEECDAPPCANGYANYNGYNNYGGYANNYGGGYGYDAGSYPVGAYDAEAYDASPTRQKAPSGAAPTSSRAVPETLPREAVQRGGYSLAPQYRRPSFAFGSFNVQTLVGNKRQAPNFAPVEPLPATRSDRYEEEYAVQTFAPNASQIRQVSNLTQATRPTQNAQIRQAAVIPHSTEIAQNARRSQPTQIRQSARYPQPTQTVVPNVPNVRSTQPRQIADATPLVEERATGRPRTFGQVRPNPTNAR